MLFPNAISNFEELKSYYPIWYQNVVEMMAIFNSLGHQLDNIEVAIEKLVDNNFIYTSDNDTLDSLESFLKIEKDNERDIEERRKLVASFFVGNGHIGEPEIRDVLKTFTASPVSISLLSGTINITVTKDVNDTFLLTDFYLILKKKIPAHLDINITIVSPLTCENNVGCVICQYKEEALN